MTTEKVTYMMGYQGQSAIVIRVAFTQNGGPLSMDQCIVARYAYKDYLVAGARACAEVDTKIRNKISRESNLYNEEIQ